MKRTIRMGVWETNSSSVHSITICTKEEYQKWEDGDLYFDPYEDKLTKNPTNYWGEDNYSWDEFMDKYDEYENFEETYITPHGDEIIAFGYYGTEY